MWRPAVKGFMKQSRECRTDKEPYYESALPLVPESQDLEVVREAALGCKACHLWRCGTQTVFGEGNPKAKIMLVGEQPGDKEDLAGRPFVGPAGKVLDDALELAGVSRNDVYITNTVKHFKWVPQGEKRLHRKPNAKEQMACRPWLEAEIARVQPRALVLLGATAAQALLGSSFRLTKHRGELFESRLAPTVLATLHPSAILRIPDVDERHRAFDSMISDLKLISLKVANEPRGYLA